MAGLRARHRQARVAQVLDAASVLFAEQGYEATRIEEIAERATVAPATVYNYFATKPNILLALAVRHVRASLPERKALVRNPPDDPVEAIFAFEALLADQALRHLTRECWRAILAAPFREPGGIAHRTALRFGFLIRRHYVGLLTRFQARGTIKPGVDIEELAALAYAIGTHHFGRLAADEAMTVEDLKASVERHLALVFDGVVTPAAARRRVATLVATSKAKPVAKPVSRPLAKQSKAPAKFDGATVANGATPKPSGAKSLTPKSPVAKSPAAKSPTPRPGSAQSPAAKPAARRRSTRKPEQTP